MNKQIKHLYIFHEYWLDATERVLLRGGETVPLTPKVFDILLALVENRGRVVEKDEMMRLVWRDTVVEEGNLNRNISTLRKALGETPGQSRYIETVPKRGYRFVAPVSISTDNDDGLIVASFTRSRIITEEEEDRSAQTSQLASRATTPEAILTPRRIAAAAGILLILLVAGASYRFFADKSNERAPAAKPRSLAVLPFKPMSDDGSDESLGLGMADALITGLSRIKEMSICPTSAVSGYDDPRQNLLEVGRELGVDSLLDGRVQRLGARIRVTVQLISVPDGKTLWAEKFDEQFTDIFAVQDSISEQVTRALTLELSGEERGLLTKRYTHNTEAYELYLKGRYFWNKRSQEGLRKGIEYFEKALGKDPTYALAYAGLADSYVLGGGLRLPASTVMPKARSAAMRALELDDHLAEAHASLGLVRMAYDHDMAAAENEFQRAIEINPNYASARQWYADCLAVTGRIEEALREVEQARKLNPLSLIINRDKARIHYFARQYDQAIEQLQKTLDLNRNFAAAHFTLGFVYVQKGMHEEAIASFEKSVALIGDRSPIKASLGYAYAMSGNRDEALRVLDELQTKSKRGAAPAYEIAMIHIGLGNRDETLRWLEKAYEERSYRIIYIGADPIFDGLRPDPRFADLARRIGVATRRGD